MEYDPETIAAVFGRTAPTYDSVIPFFREFGGRLVEVAALQPGERIVDVASGRGATLFPAAERVGPSGEVLGADLSEAMVERLSSEIAERGLTNVAVRRIDAEALDVETGSFDVAICGFVLHLVARPEAVAAEVRRVLRPGGRIAASVPAGAGLSWEFLAQLFGRYGPRAVRPVPVPFRPDFDLPATVVAAGFDIERTVDEEIEFHFADADAWWTWAWSNGIRAFLEVLPPDALEELRRDLSVELDAMRTEHGIPMSQQVKFVVAYG